MKPVFYNERGLFLYPFLQVHIQLKLTMIKEFRQEFFGDDLKKEREAARQQRKEL